MTEPHPILAAFQASSGPLKMTDPISSLLNGEIIDLDPETGSAVLAFAPDERFKQAGGIIHGGIIATMLDSVLALAAFTRLRAGQSFATVSLTTHYLRQSNPGRHIARARLDRMGARMIFASGELMREGEDTPLATATAVMAMTRT